VKNLVVLFVALAMSSVAFGAVGDVLFYEDFEYADQAALEAAGWGRLAGNDPAAVLTTDVKSSGDKSLLIEWGLSPKTVFGTPTTNLLFSVQWYHDPDGGWNSRDSGIWLQGIGFSDVASDIAFLHGKNAGPGNTVVVQTWSAATGSINYDTGLTFAVGWNLLEATVDENGWVTVSLNGEPGPHTYGGPEWWIAVEKVMLGQWWGPNAAYQVAFDEVTFAQYKNVLVTPQAVQVEEGAAGATVTVTLVDEPTADVTVTVTPSVNGMDYALDAADPNDPIDLVFTPADWAAKTFTVTAVDDVEIEDYNEAGQLALSISSADPCYAGAVLPTIDVDIIDNETEYVPHTYTVNTASWGDVTVHQADLDQVGNDIVPGGNTRMLSGVANWCTAYPDFFAGQLGLSPERVLYSFQAVNANQTPLVTEVDVPEGTYDVYAVYYAYDGGGDWHTGVCASTNETDPLLRYNWASGDVVDVHKDVPDSPHWTGNVAQVGQVTGSQLALYISRSGEGGTLAAAHYCGLGYRLAPWVVTESDGSTAVSEDGATDTIEFQLMVEPTSDVTVDLSVDAQLTVTPSQLVFPVADWNTPQSVTVGAVDDSDLETDPHSGVLSYASDSADPNDALSGSVVVEIAENDCGAWGYHSMDFDQDCDVDMADLAAFAAQYLFCSRPHDPACVDLR